MKQFTDNQFRKLNELIISVKNEHSNQITKWGIQTHSIFEWVTYTTEELGSLAKAVSEYIYRGGDAKRVYDEAIQVATLSLKIAEMFIEECK